MQWQSLDQIWYFLKSKMVSWARGLRLMRSTSAAKFGWSSGIASANTATAKPWPLTANRTVNILVLWGVEIKHMHNYDETWVSPCHVVQENEKPGKKTANINPKKLRSVITVKAHCSVTRIIQQKRIIWFLVIRLTMDVIYDFCYIHSPTGDYPTAFDAISLRGGVIVRILP